MDIIQEIKKRQEKIDANTERIFNLQAQNMKLWEEIRKLQRGGLIMYSICITGHGKDKKVHEVFSNSFERSEFSSYIIAKMLDDLTGAPFYCIPDMMHIKNDDTGGGFMFLVLL
jgi:transcriptional regulatory protein LevR